MFKILILVCSAAVPGAECDESTAFDVVRLAPVPSASQCGLSAQSTIAATGIAPRMGESYLKVVCRRSGVVEARR